MITIAILFVLYGLFGRMLPGIIAHRGLGLHELVNYLYYTTEGIFGTPMGVSSTFIYLFILFGAYLETTGLGKFFIDISNAIAGWASGGPAKVAVISSALEGKSSGYLQCFGRHRIRQLRCQRSRQRLVHHSDDEKIRLRQRLCRCR